jgi:hypothetical protein
MAVTPLLQRVSLTAVMTGFGSNHISTSSYVLQPKPTGVLKVHLSTYTPYVSTVSVLAGLVASPNITLLPIGCVTILQLPVPADGVFPLRVVLKISQIC